MAYSCFDVELKNGIARLELCRPEKRNSMTREFWTELPEIVNQLHDEGEARVIVLTSTGPHFTAGMDLSVFAGSGAGEGEARSRELGRRRANLRSNVLHLQETFSCLERARMPVLAAIQGGCFGGGVDMISACDCRYATEDAFFVIQEINIGMTADVGTLQRLPKIIPEGVVRELAYTGARLDAQRAREIGLVNAVYADRESMISGVMDVAAQIAARSPLAVWGSKEMINYSRDHSVEDGLNYIATWQTGMFQGADMAEAFKAKSEKRDPEYEDLAPLSKDL
jgi:enoyl-CoA hydratase